MQDVTDLKAWFERRVVDNYRLFFSIAYQNLRDAGEAEDLVQEACLRAWRELGTLREPSSLVGWIATTIRRLAYDLRGRRRPVAIADEAFEEVPQRGAQGPAVHYDEREHLLQGVASLPANQAVVITLRFLEGLDVAQIAQRLGITANGVRVRLHRALERLRLWRCPRAEEAGAS